MKCLGMDLGTKTLGLATSDKLGIIASPYKTIRYEKMSNLISQVKEVIEQEKIEVLVLGYPKNMNNTLGEAINRTEEFANALKEETNMDINYVDERLTTTQAENILLDEDMSRRDRKGVIDAVAASIILDTYLRMKEWEKND